MIEDKILILRFKAGSSTALARIYEKYENYLLTVAMGLLNETNAAEDVVHDVIVKFAQSADTLKLRGNLRAYLAKCVVNRVRDLIRVRLRHPVVGLEEAGLPDCEGEGSEQSAIIHEDMLRLNRGLAQLSYEQREAIMLRVHSEMTFKQIAQLQDVSANTVRGRYRYGLEKLRSLLNSEVTI